MNELIDKQEILTKAKNLCEGCYLMEHCGQCNPKCRLRQAIDMIEESSSVFMIPENPSEDGESEMNSTKFKPGDKFILELGEERRMFHEFKIAGTDLYVKTDLLEKLKKYEPEVKAETVTSCHGSIDKQIEKNVLCSRDCE